MVMDFIKIGNDLVVKKATHSHTYGRKTFFDLEWHSIGIEITRYAWNISTFEWKKKHTSTHEE